MLVVLVVTLGLFVALTLLSASGPRAEPFGGSRAQESGEDAALSASENLAANQNSSVADEQGELPIDQHYSKLYPNEARLATFLSSKGLDDLHIAAIIGVFKRESGNGDYDIDPAAVEDNLIGHGIAQWSFERWSGAHYGRPEQGLKYYAEDLGQDWEMLSVQLDYLWAEMTGEGPAVEYVYVQYNHEDYLATSTLEEAVDFYLAQFMNCGGAKYDDRLAFAQAALDKILY